MIEEINKHFGIVRNCIDGKETIASGIGSLEEIAIAFNLRRKEFAKFSEDFNEALRLLWFFLPEEEPANPHSNKAVDKERHKRWHRACELYSKYAGQL